MKKILKSFGQIFIPTVFFYPLLITLITLLSGNNENGEQMVLFAVILYSASLVALFLYFKYKPYNIIIHIVGIIMLVVPVVLSEIYVDTGGKLILTELIGLYYVIPLTSLSISIHLVIDILKRKTKI